MAQKSSLQQVIKVNVPHVLVSDDGGQWIHSEGSDFCFAYIPNDYTKDQVNTLTAAFEVASGMSTSIKNAVLNTSGQTVVNGLYLQDQPAMTTAMNSISGMGMTSADTESESGSGTAADINQQFFEAILGGLGGDVKPLMSYLNSQMQTLQVQTQSSNVNNDWGTVIGLVSLTPILNTPVITFDYAFSDQQTSSWFVKVTCGGAEHYDYNYTFTIVEYNYVPAS